MRHTLPLRTVSRCSTAPYDRRVVTKHNQFVSRYFYLLGLLAVALLASSCRHSEAAPAPVTMDIVIKAIHDYGAGHNGQLTTASVTKPDETEDDYVARISQLLTSEDFAQLEKIQQQNRTDKGRLLGGVWKSYAFYEGAGALPPGERPSDADYESQISLVKKWSVAYPRSVTAHIALANLYLSYAGYARGTGYANTVSDSNWDRFRKRYAQAIAILVEASSLPDKDPSWYYAMQSVALFDGWDKAVARDLFDQAVAFEPDYYHYYRAYSNYLLPQWYGDSGDIPALAEEVYKRFPDPNGSMLYFYTISGLACYCQEALQELQLVSFPKASQGYANIVRFYGATNLNGNRFAFMATTFKDPVSAREGFKAVETMDWSIWQQEQVYKDARYWVSSQ
jgi:tetratricopeptide (TPR) repeat protein